jgi:hypothetical protein
MGQTISFNLEAPTNRHATAFDVEDLEPCWARYLKP